MHLKANCQILFQCSQNYVISMVNLLYKIKLDNKDKKLLAKSLKKNKDFLSSVQMTKRNLTKMIFPWLRERWATATNTVYTKNTPCHRNQIQRGGVSSSMKLDLYFLSCLKVKQTWIFRYWSDDEYLHTSWSVRCQEWEIRMEELEQTRKEVDKTEDKKMMKQNMFKAV